MDTGSREREHLVAGRVRGLLFLERRSYTEAEAVLHESLLQSRALHLVEEEVATLTLLASLRTHQGRLDDAKDLLADVWPWVEFGPYRLLHADALLVLARAHWLGGQVATARDAAQRAHDLAWCDGPGHSYYWGVQFAEAQLASLGAVPGAPPSTPTRPNLIDIEIDHKDEFRCDPMRWPPSANEP